MVTFLRIFLPPWFKGLLKIILLPKYYLMIFINDVRSLLGKKFGDSKVIFVAGYPKSGTTWVENFISNIPGYSPRVLYGSDKLIRGHNLPTNSFINFPNYAYSSVKTHIYPNERNIDILISNKIKKVLIMYRDPRDIVVSNYYHVLKENPWLESDPSYKDYSKISKNEAILHSIRVILNDYREWVKGWLNVQKNNTNLDCMVLRYEDLLANPTDSFNKIIEFYGIDLSESVFKKTFLASDLIVSRYFTPSISSFIPGLKSTKRNGGRSEWMLEMNFEHKKILKEEIGDLLIELGYENDYEW